ncbi:MAG TPA: hypothetical protein VE091_09655 [Gemmatimonadales bacterium]|nr:hypothetical protein [Gemmatimonadales bacterium]
MMRHLGAAVAAVSLSLACRGEPVRAQRDATIAQLVDSLKPAVERAAGFRFRTTPRSAMRSRDQVRAYLIAKLRQELPPSRVRGIETAYRLLALLPDTLELEPLLVNLYSEQVAGYYDPDSTMLFGVTGADRLQLRLVLAHEMVHALQGQYLPLDSILHDIRSNDRLTAAQAVLEGQATLVSIRVLSPGVDVTAQQGFWDEYREQVAEQQDAMPVFAHAPLLIRETLLFPYLDGAEFMRWWGTSALRDSLPAGARMPASTEQILTPDRYRQGDQPVALRFVAGSRPRTYEDDLGELEIRVLDAQLRGDVEAPRDIAPIGWGGDLYGLFDSPKGAALVWYVVWDDPASDDRFLAASGARLRARERPGYRVELTRVEVDRRPASRFVIAPTEWAGWRDLPRVEVVR